MRARTLVLLSVPFTRNMRYLIYSELFKALQASSDILVIGPQFANAAVRKEFEGEGVKFWGFDQSPEDIALVPRYLYALSEMLRRHGFWYRFRNAGLKYYWHAITDVSINSTADEVRRTPSRLRNRVIGWLGYPRFAWRIFDRLFGRWFYDTNALKNFIKSYDNVVLVQTANWGFQERFLGFCARLFGLRSVLVPYTTDQLIINGHMITEFDAVCTQGPVESRYALYHHAMNPSRIAPLGMIWRRNLEGLHARGLVAAESVVAEPRTLTILYAGLTPTYFPRASELQAIDHILSAIRGGRLPHTRLVYRPVAKDEADARALAKRFEGDPLITLQRPQPTLVGVDQTTVGTVEAEVTEYVSQLLSSDVFVMSATTTMMFDALHFDIPCVANFTDPSDILRKAGFTTTYCENDETLRASPDMPVAHSFAQLIDHLEHALHGHDRAALLQKVKSQLFSQWDYPSENFRKVFFDALQLSGDSP